MKIRLFAVILLSLSFGCFRAPDNVNVQPAETPFPVPTPAVDLAKPLDISTLPDDLKLCEKITQIIDQSEFQNARWGVIVISLRDGRVPCAREAQKLFNPASVQKLLTSVVALDKLGPDFRWKTHLYSNKQIEGETLDGDLILYGEGAPDLDEKALDRLVLDLKNKGLKRVKGNLIGDESFFRGDKLGDGWAWNELQWYYGAEASALTFNENQAEITLQNGRPVASTAYVTTRGEIKPADDIEAIGLKREISENEVYAWGSGNSLQARVSVTKPGLWAAKTLREKFEKNGIAVEGEVKFTDWKNDRQIDLSKAVELASVESAPLGEIVRKMNKDSVNLYAELILRTLGKRFGETAPDENPKMQKLRGDDAAGAAFVKKWLIDNRIANGEVKIHDGSGLSRLDFVTPETVGRVLIFAAQSKFAAVFRDSLPVAGTDGTLRGRLRDAAGRILGKTGSIMYVNALAGYAVNTGGETFAFAVIVNNETHKNDSSPVVDRIASTLLN